MAVAPSSVSHASIMAVSVLSTGGLRATERHVPRAQEASPLGAVLRPTTRAASARAMDGAFFETSSSLMMAVGVLAAATVRAARRGRGSRARPTAREGSRIAMAAVLRHRGSSRSDINIKPGTGRSNKDGFRTPGAVDTLQKPPKLPELDLPPDDAWADDDEWDNELTPMSFAGNLDAEEADEEEEDEEQEEEQDEWVVVVPPPRTLGLIGKQEEVDEVPTVMMKRPKFEIQRILPEDTLRRQWDERNDPWSWYLNDTPRFTDGSGSPLPDALMNGPNGADIKKRQANMIEDIEIELLKKVEDFEKKNKNPFNVFGEASPEDKELYSRVSVSHANERSRKHMEAKRNKPRIGDEVGTGKSSPNAFVEIRARWDGPNEQAVNCVVSDHLGISPEKASKLVDLGSVWAYDEWSSKSWYRFYKGQKVSADQVLRVFPNPERFPTCYVEDWKERVKKVDTDFIVVDKPPLLPCFAPVSNGKETLSQCVREALRIRKNWGGVVNHMEENMQPCYSIDDEVSGLVVLTRHDKSVEAFDDWLRAGKVTFEYVAICTKSI
ncbi:unnamed protein product, partial [Polarella glacialis]